MLLQPIILLQSFPNWIFRPRLLIIVNKLINKIKLIHNLVKLINMLNNKVIKIIIIKIIINNQLLINKIMLYLMVLKSNKIIKYKRVKIQILE